MNKKIMINCDEASIICDKSQYCEATFLDKIKLKMHLFLCKKCGLYSEQNKVMSKIFNTHLVKHNHASGLSEEDKANLKEKLEHQIN